MVNHDPIQFIQKNILRIRLQLIGHNKWFQVQGVGIVYGFGYLVPAGVEPFKLNDQIVWDFFEIVSFFCVNFFVAFTALVFVGAGEFFRGEKTGEAGLERRVLGYV